MAEFQTSVTLNIAPERLFDFLIQPDNAVELAPPGTTLEIVNAPEMLVLGARVEFDITGFGPKQRFVHEVIVCEPPQRIAEKQIVGIFEQFIHEAELTSDGNGGVVLLDRIVFEPPSGLAGFLLTENRIQRMLEDGYNHRHLVLQQRFPG